MIIGYPELVFMGGIVVAVFAFGAFVSSRLNNAVIKAMRRDLEHMKNNQRMVREALQARELKEDARNALIAVTLAAAEGVPRDVTIINTADAPVPVQEAGEK